MWANAALDTGIPPFGTTAATLSAHPTATAIRPARSAQDRCGKLTAIHTATAA
jgi:hypothetical protein